MTLNTSFNVKGQAIVNTPENALETFYGSGLDNMIIGNFKLISDIFYQKCQFQSKDI